MRKSLLIIGLASLLMIGANVNAQNTSGGYFDGNARALITNNSFDDTTGNEGRATGGYTAFDLVIHADRNDVLEASAILRVRNEFGGFFGDGVNFEFRQIQLKGVIGQKVKYELGDLDVALSPYTLWNDETDYHEFESEIFGIRRNVLNYENFYTDDNTWRMQGVNIHTGLKFDSGIEKLTIRLLGNRVETTDLTTIPDRFLFGGRLGVVQSKYFAAGINIISLSDLGSSIGQSAFNYNNQSFTTDYAFNYDVNSDIKVGLNGEAGFSTLRIIQGGTAADGGDSIVEPNDAFFDIGGVFEYKPFGIKARIAYRRVEAFYNAPGAQTRRIILDQANPQFTEAIDPAAAAINTTRTLSLVDRFSQETGLYNSQVTAGSLSSTDINTVLMAFDPVYGNATPYGLSTPNRKGLSIDVVAEDSAKLYTGHLRFDFLEEIIGENTVDVRDFRVITIGGRLSVNQLLDIDNAIVIHGGLRTENTTRSGTLPVDLNTTLLDLGLDLEVAKRLHLLVGFKTLSADGNEFSLQRNAFNTVDPTAQPSQVEEFDLSDNLFAFGAKYNFTDNAFINVQYSLTDYNKQVIGGVREEYNLDNFYVVYNQKF